MRINVYGEELTYEKEIVHKIVNGRNFYGIRMFLESSPFLHATEKDDDRSAITFWVPWTSANGNDFARLELILYNLYRYAVESFSTSEPK